MGIRFIRDIIRLTAPGFPGALTFRQNYTAFNERRMDMSKKFDFRDYVIPVVMGVAAFVGAVMDNKKNQKIDELIEKVDNLETNKKEESQ